MTLPMVRAGVIGLGVGEQHVIGYQQIPGCEVVAICDQDPDRLDDVGTRHGIPRRHLSWRKLVEEPSLDVVSVCSYDDYHADQVVTALRAGKHVMVEKPIALSRHDLERLVSVYSDSDRILTSNLILRASPRFRSVYKDVRRGHFGRIFYLEGDYIHAILHKITDGWRGRVPGYSVVYGGGVHLIDLLRWIMGEEVTEVSAMGSDLLVQGSGYPAEDTIAALLRFEGGAIAKSLTTFGPQRPQLHALQIYGTRGTFVNDTPHAKQYFGSNAADELLDRSPYPGVAKGDLLADFIDAVRCERQPEVSATDVVRVMDVCFAVVDALRSRRTVPVSYTL